MDDAMMPLTTTEGGEARRNRGWSWPLSVVTWSFRAHYRCSQGCERRICRAMWAKNYCNRRVGHRIARRQCTMVGQYFIIGEGGDDRGHRDGSQTMLVELNYCKKEKERGNKEREKEEKRKGRRERKREKKRRKM